MEKQRERLIELVKEARKVANSYAVADMNETIADHLLSNGVIVPPCKVGDTVYSITTCGKEPLEFKVHEIIITKDRTIICLKGRRYRTIVSEAFGKTIFLAKEEAEAALKGGAE